MTLQHVVLWVSAEENKASRGSDQNVSDLLRADSP